MTNDTDQQSPFARPCGWIGADHLPHVFDRFYRVDGSRARETGGAGLGLAIVKQLVTVQRGRVWVESRSGEGSTFGFSVPKAGLPVATHDR